MSKKVEKWRPKRGEKYYVPCVGMDGYCYGFKALNLGSEKYMEIRVKLGLVCKTLKEAVSKAKKMLEAIQ